MTKGKAEGEGEQIWDNGRYSVPAFKCNNAGGGGGGVVQGVKVLAA